jgi:hypothetical protein
MNENIFYLDNTFFYNPDLSPKANTFYKIFYPVSVGLFLIVGFYLVVIEKNIGNLPLMIYGLFVITFVICQRIIHKKYGRKYVKGTKESLILKTKYFKKSVSIPWDSLNKIQFIGQEFLVQTESPTLAVIRFKAPLDRYLEIREFLKSFVVKYKIKLEE